VWVFDPAHLIEATCFLVIQHKLQMSEMGLGELVQAIKSKEGDVAGAQLQYTCRCSFLQIYNEQVSDLLKPADKPLTLRHDTARGVFAENLSEYVVVNGVLPHSL
jgi:hypothetical protein